MQRKVIFLDRDGTLIEDKIYLNDPNDIVYLPGVFDAMVLLRDLGYDFVVVTNQSGVARGIVEIENLHEVHRRMQASFLEVNVDFLGFYYAPYLPSTDHPLRKPNPGMLMQAAKEFGIDLKNSWMVGDRMTDVEAGHRAGTKSIFIGTTEKISDSPFAPLS